MLRFAVVGAGRISRDLCGGAALVEGAEVVAASAQDIARAEAFAKDMNIPKAYGSYEEMLSDSTVDAVYIGNTTNMHYDSIKMCLEAGKHVLGEKAMVETEARAAECFALAKSKGLFLMEAMWARFLPKTVKVREWINSGRIGRVVAVQANIGNNVEKDMKNRFYDPALGGGVMYDLGVYAIDLVTYFTGLDITGWSADVIRAETGIDETVSLNLDLGGVPAHSLITFAAAVPEDCYIYGEKGCIRVPRMHWGSDALLLDPGMNEIERFSQPERYGMRFEIEEVVSCINAGRLTSSIASPEMTLTSSRIYDSILGTK